jgi:UDP:flavonoid glycosyltransferase YjiC (YdhE family)
MSRVLVYTAPARGHLDPVVPTLLELLRREHQVGVRTLSDEVATLRQLGLRAEAVAAPLPRFADAAELFLAAPLLLAYTAEPFEYPRHDWPGQVRLVGPGVWDPPAPATPWLEGDDRGGQPLVLVTCSTEFQDDGRLAEVALFSLPGAGLRVVVTTAGVDPARFVVPPGCRVARFLPHGPILRRAACVVCHAGMGITRRR